MTESRKVAEAAMLLPCILEVPVLNLCRDTNYSDLGFSGFFSPSRQMPGYKLQLSHGKFLSRNFIFIIIQSIYTM
jgi:hypothetical protein